MSRDPDPPALIDLTVYLLSQTARLGKAALDERLGRRGLQMRHMAVLAAVADGDVTSQLALGRSVRMDASDVTAVVDTLQELGLVERVVDAADRRRRVVRLTDAGAAELGTLRSLATEVADELLAGLPSGRRKRLHDDLLAVLRASRAGGAIGDRS